MMQSEVDRLAQKFRNALLRQERTAASEMVRAYGEIWKRIQAELFDLLDEWERSGGQNVGTEWLFQFERLKRLQAQVEDELRVWARYASNSIAQQQRAAIEAAQRNGAQLIEAASPGILAGMTRLPVSAVQEIVGFTQAGTPLQTLLSEWGAEAGQTFSDTLVQGIALGKHPKAIVREIRKVLGRDLGRALKVARTEILRAYRSATLEGYKNSGVISGWVWRSARNVRTCAMCWAMDGTEHELDDPLDDHPNGRCFALPIVQGAPLTFDTGIAAFEKLPLSEQAAILGPAKFAAWRNGTITLADLVGRKFDSVWGSMRYERSLLEVLGKTDAKTWARFARRNHLGKLAEIAQLKNAAEVERWAKNLGYSLTLNGHFALGKIAAESLIPLSERQILLPEIIISRTPFIKFDGRDDPAAFWKRKIYLNPESDYWTNARSIVSTYYESNWWASNDYRHPIWHEAGHALHYARTEEIWNALGPLQKSEIELAKIVSNYAAFDQREFVGEVFAGTLAGEEYDKMIWALYKKLGGYPLD